MLVELLPDIIRCRVHNVTLSNSETLEDVVGQLMASLAEIPMSLDSTIVRLSSCEIIPIVSFKKKIIPIVAPTLKLVLEIQ